MTIIISGLMYLIGYVFAYKMQRTEIAADGETYTIGTRLLILTLSLLSFLFVLIMLIRGWVKMISITGYWDAPVKKQETMLVDKKASQSKAIQN